MEDNVSVPTEPVVSDTPDTQVDQTADQGDQSADNADQSRPNQFLDPKVKNALGWRDQKLAKFKQERKQYLDENAKLRAEVEQYRAAKSAPQPPKEEDFQAYGDYLVEKAKFEILQSQNQGKKQEDQQKQDAPQMSDQERLWRAQREQHVSQNAANLAMEIPDFAETMVAYADFAEDLPPHIQNMFLEADNGALAFYNLAREGKLESLLGMSPYQAGLAIDAAQRGANRQAQSQPQGQPRMTAPQPPKPIQGARGVSPGRSEDSLSGKELLKRYKLK